MTFQIVYWLSSWRNTWKRKALFLAFKMVHSSWSYSTSNILLGQGSLFSLQCGPKMGHKVPQGSILGQIWFSLLSLLYQSEKKKNASILALESTTVDCVNIYVKWAAWLHDFLASTIMGQCWWYSVRIALYALQDLFSVEYCRELQRIVHWGIALTKLRAQCQNAH